MHFSDHKTVCYDGQFIPGNTVPFSILSPGLQYGQAVMEGIRVYDTPEGPYLFKAEEHLKRFRSGARWMKMEIPYSNHRIQQQISQLLALHGVREAYVRLLAWGDQKAALGTHHPAHTCIILGKASGSYAQDNPRLMVSSFMRNVTSGPTQQTKICGTYAMGLLAKSEAVNCGFDDAIMLQVDGFVAGTTGANIFLEKDEVLYTPPAQHCLAGITRGVVLELAAVMGLPVVEKPLQIEMLYAADAVFLTGTATEIKAVAGINHHTFSMPWLETQGHDLALKFRQITYGRDLALGTLI